VNIHERTPSRLAVLRHQRIKQLEECITRLHAALDSSECRLSAILLDFQRIAARHGIPVPISALTFPHPDHDQSTRAARYRVGSRASTILGVVVFSLAGMASLSFPVPQFVLLLGCAVVGLLLGAIVNTGVCLLTGASAANPSAAVKIALLAQISGSLGLTSAIAFMLLRFIADSTALALVSAIIVCFETAVYVLGGALEAAHLLYDWSGRLALQYEMVRTERDEIALQLQKAEAELAELNDERDQKTKEGDSHHEELDNHDHTDSLPAHGSNIRPGTGTNTGANGSGTHRVDTDSMG